MNLTILASSLIFQVFPFWPPPPPPSLIHTLSLCSGTSQWVQAPHLSIMAPLPTWSTQSLQTIFIDQLRFLPSTSPTPSRSLFLPMSLKDSLFASFPFSLGDHLIAMTLAPVPAIQHHANYKWIATGGLLQAGPALLVCTLKPTWLSSRRKSCPGTPQPPDSLEASG